VATILMGWELGEGLGHVQRLLNVARPLAAEGHRVVFALANVVEPWPLFEPGEFPILQAPVKAYRPRPGDRPFLASSVADVLAVRGWENVETLLPLVEAWRRLVDSVQPKLIVADFAPTLCLAAHQSVQVVQVGNWFQMPPVHGSTLPLLLPGQPPVMPQAELLAVAREVQRQRGKAIPATLPSIFAAGERFPVFFPELDPYHAERTEPIWDPPDALAEPLPAPAAPRFFAYLTAENPSVEPILTQLALTGCPGTAYVRSASAELKDRLRLQGLTILDRPAPIAEMLTQASVIVHHGGSTANTALSAGRPQISLPQHLEQVTNAQLLAKLGVGMFLMSNAPPEAAGRALKQVLGDRRYADHAAACARRIHSRPRRPALPAILDCCRRRLQSQ
jgi:rhamnosyltransferase subunit B